MQLGIELVAQLDHLGERQIRTPASAEFVHHCRETGFSVRRQPASAVSFKPKPLWPERPPVFAGLIGQQSYQAPSPGGPPLQSWIESRGHAAVIIRKPAHG